MGGMEAYVRSRIIIDARHAIALAEQQAAIQHNGLKGRFRELLAQKLLKPWLPPGIDIGTGTVIHGTRAEFRKSTQDDLIIFDRTVLPSILIDESASEGVFLNNSVLMRVEVKSELSRAELSNYFSACLDFGNLGFVASPEASKELQNNLNARSALIAFRSDINTPKSELKRYKDTLDDYSTDAGLASIFLSIGNGLFMVRELNGGRFWCRLDSADPAEQLACFTAIISSTAVSARMERTGVDSKGSLQAGIGLLFPSEDEWKVVDTV